jgi:ADP-ribose pyrophosphatase YjhB (NUDIX family)
MRINRVAAALIEQDNQILLVQQRGPSDRVASWALPGGSLEPGEMTLDGLAREVFEETGIVLEADNLPVLQYMTEIHDPVGERLTIAYIFAAKARRDMTKIAFSDPDQEIIQAAFVPRAVAAVRLALNPYLPMSEPAVAALRGEVSSLWVYRLERGRPIRLVPWLKL